MIDPDVVIGHADAPVARAFGVGVVGLGVQGRAVLGELDAAPRLTVVRAFDPAPPAGLATPLAADLAALVADPAVDVVYVASPPAAHAEAVLAAVAAGKAVLCEKPLAPDPGGADRLAAAVREAGVPGAVNFYLATSPAGRRIAARVADGSLGTLERIEIVSRFRAWPRPWQAAAGAWLAGAAEGGFTREVISHFVFLADRVAGPGRLVSASVERGADGLEVRVEAVLDHGGVRCTIDAALGGAADEEHRMTIAGTRGSTVLTDWDALDGDVPPSAADDGVAPALVALLDGAATSLPGLDAGARVVGIVEGLLG